MGQRSNQLNYVPTWRYAQLVNSVQNRSVVSLEVRGVLLVTCCELPAKHD